MIFKITSQQNVFWRSFLNSFQLQNNILTYINILVTVTPGRVLMI